MRAPRGLAPLLPLAGCGVGAPGRPGPHDVGAVGPSAPPARSAALRPALPARPRLRRRPCRAALPAHSPPGVAGPRPSPLPAAKPGRALRPSALPLRGPAIYTAARTGGASAAFPALRARRGAGERRLRAGMPAVSPAGKPKASPAQGGRSRPQAGGLPAGAPASEGKTWRVSRPLAGSRPSLILVNGGAVMFAVACRISASGRVWWLVCRSGGVFGWSLSRPARSLWPSALAAASACQSAAESAPGCFWPAGAPVGRLAVVRCK